MCKCADGQVREGVYVTDQAPRKRWESLQDQLQDAAPATDPGPPPYPAVVETIWLVFRIDRAAAAPFVAPGLTISPSNIGVLGVYTAASGSRLSPYTRAFCSVAIEGHDAPDTKEAVYIAGDVVTPHASPAMREHYAACGTPGEPRVWHEDGLLIGTAASGGKEWLRVAIRPNGPTQAGLTGLDAYVSTSKRGLSRHVVSYFGAVGPAEVVSLEIGNDAPPAFQALRPAEIMLCLTASGLHATWGEPHPISAGAGAQPSKDPASVDAFDLLRSVKLTPAEAKLAVAVGQGQSAREAADQLGISEHTARSTLKQVYGKLGIRKRAELGHLIARLQLGQK